MYLGMILIPKYLINIKLFKNQTINLNAVYRPNLYVAQPDPILT